MSWEGSRRCFYKASEGQELPGGHTGLEVGGFWASSPGFLWVLTSLLHCLALPQPVGSGAAQWRGARLTQPLAAEYPGEGPVPLWVSSLDRKGLLGP